MTIVFYVAAAVALLATALVITRRHAIHALLYFIVSLFAVAVIFFTLGAPFVAALEVIVYAGAIMVLFLFVVMMLNPGPVPRRQRLLSPRAWLGPSVLAAILAAEMIWAIARGTPAPAHGRWTTPAQVGAAMFGPYVLGAEIAGMLLLAGLVAAAHLGRRQPEPPEPPPPGEPPPHLPEPPGELPGEPPGTPPDEPGQPPEARA